MQLIDSRSTKRCVLQLNDHLVSCLDVRMDDIMSNPKVEYLVPHNMVAHNFVPTYLITANIAADEVADILSIYLCVLGHLSWKQDITKVL